jgi:hypothetical protein
MFLGLLDPDPLKWTSPDRIHVQKIIKRFPLLRPAASGALPVHNSERCPPAQFFFSHHQGSRLLRPSRISLKHTSSYGRYN